ncbi:diphthamide biosynthesis enzyme Dph2 [Archaeoglobales archaeon]|nr:MAG: diphthamide biosynthesis enzyme Dph2 [Archaeoglobales archaeon]
MKTSFEKIFERIDFSKIFRELEERKAKEVGIQLPDGLKFFSKEFAEKFEEKGFDVIISGSASYGACDIDISLLDEVDILVHFAHLPVGSVERVIYAPYYYNYEIENLESWIDRIEERKIALAGTAQYAWKFPEVKRYLEGRGVEVELGGARGRIGISGQVLGCNYSVLRDIGAKAILFIGDGMFHPRGAAIYSGRKVYFFNPLANEFTVIGKEFVERFLRERYIQISRAMQNLENGVAIVVSSKIGQKRLSTARRLKSIAKKKGMKSDILFFNEISPERFMNFPYGVYVNTACPRITYDDFRKYEKPLLTPQEFEILVGKRDWEDYKIDEIDEIG